MWVSLLGCSLADRPGCVLESFVTDQWPVCQSFCRGSRSFFLDMLMHHKDLTKHMCLVTAPSHRARGQGVGMHRQEPQLALTGEVRC